MDTAMRDLEPQTLVFLRDSLRPWHIVWAVGRDFECWAFAEEGSGQKELKVFAPEELETLRERDERGVKDDNTRKIEDDKMMGRLPRRRPPLYPA
jgi:hypothetical protein